MEDSGNNGANSEEDSVVVGDEEEEEDEEELINHFLWLKGKKVDVENNDSITIRGFRLDVLRDSRGNVFGLYPVFGEDVKERILPFNYKKYGLSALDKKDSQCVGFWASCLELYSYKDNQEEIETICDGLEAFYYKSPEEEEGKLGWLMETWSAVF